MNNSYDRDLVSIMQAAEQVATRSQALNVLALVQHKQHMKDMRKKAIRASYINPYESF